MRLLGAHNIENLGTKHVSAVKIARFACRADSPCLFRSTQGLLNTRSTMAQSVVQNLDCGHHRSCEFDMIWSKVFVARTPLTCFVLCRAKWLSYLLSLGFIYMNARKNFTRSSILDFIYES